MQWLLRYETFKLATNQFVNKPLTDAAHAIFLLEGS